MKIYYYCVTTESPVGYIPGSLLVEPQRATNYELQRSNIPTLIRRCFEQGLVLKAFGKLPSKSDYFLLVKKLTAKGNEDKGEAAAYGLALALETDDENEYRRWLNPDSASERDIAEAIKNTMAIDRHVNDFGFTVRPKPLNNLAKMSFRSLLEKSGISPNQDLAEETYFQLSSEETDFAELKEALKLEDPESNFEWLSPKSNGWVKYGKKNRACGIE